MNAPLAKTKAEQALAQNFEAVAAKLPGGRAVADARKAAIGDHLIICAYSQYEEAEMAGYQARVVLVDEKNRPR